MGTFLVGIAGGTASGKTSLARKLLTLDKNHQIALLELDRYYRSQELLIPELRAKVNYDHPDALEFNLLIDQLTKLRNGTPIHAPLYDFSTHCRDPINTTLIKPCAVIIVEGILVFADPSLRELFDLKVFVDTPEEVRLVRRIERDSQERGRSAESVREQWSTTVEPMHRSFCEPGKALADIVVDGHKDLTPAAESLWETVRQRANFCAR